MKRSAFVALTIGLLLFVALLAWRGVGLIAQTFLAAGWGIVVVALFHLLPLLLDGAAVAVLLPPRARKATMPGTDAPYLTDQTRRASLFWRIVGARWACESVNSLMPAGQMGGPVVMARLLANRSAARTDRPDYPTTEDASRPSPAAEASPRHYDAADAGAIVTVATTQQMFAQGVFAIMGIVVLALHAGRHALTWPLLIAIGVFAAIGIGFYKAQRRGLFAWLAGGLARTSFGRARPSLLAAAARLDQRIRAVYTHAPAVRASFALNLIGWIVGTGEVWLALKFIGHPVGWVEAFALESLGQAVRGAAFAIPGALGVQEGGLLLLAPLLGISADTAIALSLCKRARELLLGLPGLLYWHWQERALRRTASTPALRTLPHTD
jgi:putative membrane protein